MRLDRHSFGEAAAGDGLAGGDLLFHGGDLDGADGGQLLVEDLSGIGVGEDFAGADVEFHADGHSVPGSSVDGDFILFGEDDGSLPGERVELCDEEFDGLVDGIRGCQSHIVLFEAAEVSETYKDKYKPYDRYPVTIPTHLTGLIEFWNGALITVITSFDVYAHGHSPIEIYGTEGSMMVPDPNTFGGPVKIFRPGYDGWKEMPLSHIYSENSRSIGAAEMAYSMQVGRPHRVNSDLAYHVLEIMLSFQKSSDLGARVELKSKCERPAALPLGLEPGQVELPSA